MSKTPFEVRLDVLKMAQDLLANKTSSELAIMDMKTRSKSSREIDKALEKVTTCSYSANDVITEATALYAFINNRS